MGIFTMKSAYHISLNIQMPNDQGESSTGDPFRVLWKTIWRLKLPSKIRIFAWRACKKGLPSMEVLKNRGLNVNPVCMRCERESESISHAIWACKKLRGLWALSGLSDLLSGLGRDLCEITFLMVDQGLTEQLESFWTMAWYIWWDRNKRVHGDQYETDQELFRQAQQFYDEVKQLRQQSRDP